MVHILNIEENARLRNIPVMLEIDDPISLHDLEIINKLSYHKKVLGIIFKNNDTKTIINLSALNKENFELYCGNDFLIIPSISLGVKGIISVIGNAYPNEVNEIVECSCDNLFKARNTFNHFKQVIKDISENVSSVKYLMYLKGVEIKRVRLPLEECSALIKRKIEEDYLNL